MPDWRPGDRIQDADFDATGTVVAVGGWDDVTVLEVRWDDGKTSDFVPDEKTRRIDGARG